MIKSHQNNPADKKSDTQNKVQNKLDLNILIEKNPAKILFPQKSSTTQKPDQQDSCVLNFDKKITAKNFPSKIFSVSNNIDFLEQHNTLVIKLYNMNPEMLLRVTFQKNRHVVSIHLTILSKFLRFFVNIYLIQEQKFPETAQRYF